MNNYFNKMTGLNFNPTWFHSGRVVLTSQLRNACTFCYEFSLSLPDFNQNCNAAKGFSGKKKSNIESN